MNEYETLSKAKTGYYEINKLTEVCYLFFYNLYTVLHILLTN